DQVEDFEERHEKRLRDDARRPEDVEHQNGPQALQACACVCVCSACVSRSALRSSKCQCVLFTFPLSLDWEDAVGDDGNGKEHRNLQAKSLTHTTRTQDMLTQFHQLRK